MLTFIVFLVFFPYWFPSSNLSPCVEAVYFVSFFHEATIRSRTVHTVVRGTDQFTHLCVLHIGRRYAWLCFQKVRLHSADVTTIPVGSFRRDLWMFLYEAYFVWLPTMYFQCAVCAHLCLGLRRLGCGWLWDECSPRLLCSRNPSTLSLITHVPGDMWARMMGKSVFLSLCPTGTRKQAFVWRQMPSKTHCPSMQRPRLNFGLPNLDSSMSTVKPGPSICPVWWFIIGRDPPKFCAT